MIYKIKNKICIYCNKDYKSYNINSKYCSKSCATTCTKEIKRKEKQKILLNSNGDLLCNTCKKYKNMNDFNRTKSFIDRFQREYSCKECNYKRKQKANFESGENIPAFIRKAFNSCKYRYSKSNKNLNFDITVEDIFNKIKEQNGNCAILGIKMTYFRVRGKIHTNMSVDRIDSSKGYIKSNIQLTCHIANIMKMDLSMKDLIKYSKLIIKNNKNKK